MDRPSEDIFYYPIRDAQEWQAWVDKEQSFNELDTFEPQMPETFPVLVTAVHGGDELLRVSYKIQTEADIRALLNQMGVAS